MPWNKESFSDYEIDYVSKNRFNMTNIELAKNLGVTESRIIRLISLFNLHRKREANLEDYDNIKEVEGYENYLITDSGDVINKKNLRILSTSITKDGYHYVKLQKEGKRYSLRRSRLVAKHFCENDDPFNKIEVNHKNGNKNLDASYNLEWVTPEENKRHAKENDLLVHQYGVIHNRSMSDKRVRFICKLIAKGYTNGEIFDRLKVNDRSKDNRKRYMYKINRIRNKKSFTKISNEYF